MSLSFGATGQSVLVTGATGFIGHLLVKVLLAEGQQVTALTRNTKKVAWAFDGKVKCIENMDELPTNYPVDIIINLAGARILGWRWSELRKAVLLKSRVGLTQKLVAWIAKAEQKPKLFLSASAIGYYGIQVIGDNTELTEDAPTQSIFMAKLCHDWELAAQSAEQYGVKVVRMRFGVVLGHQGPLPMLLLPIKLFLGGKLASGKQWLSWIHVDDLLAAIAHIWRLHRSDETKASVKPVYNFTAPETLPQFEFGKVAAKVLHRPYFFPTPGWPMRLMLGEQADLLLEGQRVVPHNLLESGFTFTYPDVESALRSLYSEQNMENTYPPYVNASDQIIMFDGVCKLCSGWSRFIIRFDKRKKFKLCAVQSDEGQAILEWFGYSTDFYETMLLVQGNRVLEKSDSFLAIAGQLPFPWNLIRVFKVFPRGFRDWFYDRIALNRYKLFGKYEACMLATADHEGRFI